MPVLPRLDNYDDVYRQFRWDIPARYNIGVDICDRWANAEPGRLALLHVKPDGSEDAISYGALRETSNRLANVLRAHGVSRGDRVAIMLPQMPEVAAAHIAIYKLGAVALPVAVLFGPDALSYRLQNSGAKALITNAQGLAKLDDIRAEAPALTCVLSVDGAGDGADSFSDLLARASDDFTAVDTAADDPAMMIYTSGTTGQPKGALHAHRVLARAICRASNCRIFHSRKPATATGRRPIGPGPAACSTRCCPACFTACRWWRAGSTNSIRTKPLR